MKQGEIKVYVVNLGMYNEGFLKGEWISMPLPPEELNAILRDRVGICQQAEEFAIHDYEQTIIDIGEFTSLHDLNLLAYKLKTLTDEQIHILDIYCKSVGINDPLEVINVCLQHEDILRLTDPLYSLKKIEELLEDDYNNIDGIIGNNDLKLKICSLDALEENKERVADQERVAPLDKSQELERSTDVQRG